jgi:hypothetical protein
MNKKNILPLFLLFVCNSCIPTLRNLVGNQVIDRNFVSGGSFESCQRSLTSILLVGGDVAACLLFGRFDEGAVCRALFPLRVVDYFHPAR